MKNPIPQDWRYVVKFIALAFGIGASVQLGMSAASHLTPRVDVIEIRKVPELHEVKPKAKG